MRASATSVLGLIVMSAVASGCAGKTTHSAASAQAEARIQRAEQRDVEAAIGRTPMARKLVDSYHIDFQVLTAVVGAPAWDRLGTSGQDRFKEALWSAWRDVYTRRHPGTTERIFLKIEDLQANDLGSYFER